MNNQNFLAVFPFYSGPRLVWDDFSGICKKSGEIPLECLKKNKVEDCINLMNKILTKENFPQFHEQITEELAPEKVGFSWVSLKILYLFLNKIREVFGSETLIIFIRDYQHNNKDYKISGISYYAEQINKDKSKYYIDFGTGNTKIYEFIDDDFVECLNKSGKERCKQSVIKNKDGQVQIIETINTLIEQTGKKINFSDINLCMTNSQIRELNEKGEDLIKSMGFNSAKVLSGEEEYTWESKSVGTAIQRLYPELFDHQVKILSLGSGGGTTQIVNLTSNHGCQLKGGIAATKGRALKTWELLNNTFKDKLIELSN